MEKNQNRQKEEPECCPKFEPALWDEKTLVWGNKKFVKGSICTFMYMPLNFGSIMRKMNAKIRKSGASMQQDGMGLSDHTSGWNMDIYLAVNRRVEGLNNVTLSGQFLCKVYEGDFRETAKWMKDYETYTNSKNLKIEKTYMWYTTCPKCAKKYGKNYVAILGKIS